MEFLGWPNDNYKIPDESTDSVFLTLLDQNASHLRYDRKHHEEIEADNTEGRQYETDQILNRACCYFFILPRSRAVEEHHRQF